MTSRSHAPGRLLVAVASAAIAASLVACSATTSPASTATGTPAATAATGTPAATAATGTPAATATVTATPAAADATPGSAGAPATGGMLARGVYSNPVYRIQFRYPPDWAPEQGYDQRWSGPNGFVQVLAFDAPGLDVQQAAEQVAGHVLQPYGSDPTIEPITIDGVEGRLILPGGQGTGVQSMATVIVAPPSPIVLNTVTYHYLQINADPAHIRDIAGSATFITSQSGGPMKR